MAGYDGTRTTGFASPAEDSIAGPVDIDSILNLGNPARYLMRVRGQGFAGRAIVDGDIAVVDASIRVASGHLVIGHINGDMVLCEVVGSPARLALKAGDGTVHHLAADDDAGVSDIAVWGVVATIIRETA